MSHRTLRLLFFLAALVAGAGGAWAGAAAGGSSGAEGSSPHPVLVEQGAAIYAAYCATCHGADARGDGPVAPALVHEPPDLTRIAARRGGDFPQAEIAQTIDGRLAPPAHGGREMPVWGSRFSEELPDTELQQPIVRGRILVLVEYLRSIQRSDDAPAD